MQKCQMVIGVDKFDKLTPGMELWIITGVSPDGLVVTNGLAIENRWSI
jgi:hypothetical protein